MYQKQSREQTEDIAILTDATSQISDDSDTIQEGSEPEQRRTPYESGAHEGGPCVGESGLGKGKGETYEGGPSEDGVREGGPGEGVREVRPGEGGAR